MKSVKTALGRTIDMAALAQKHENDRAVSNVPMNAKGDRLDNKGNVKETIQNISRAQHDATEPPVQVAVSNPIQVKDPVVSVETPAEPQPINESTHEREDGSSYVEIEYDDGSVETKEIED
jgi:hypothetical protein|tara:strand:+ start:1186 stop:1548 length:363 start_codon:yes stop_codon:yes gene_type:complete